MKDAGKIHGAVKLALDEHRRAWDAAGGRWSPAVREANERLGDAHEMFYEVFGFWWTAGNVALLDFLDRMAANERKSKPLNVNMNGTGKSHE